MRNIAWIVVTLLAAGCFAQAGDAPKAPLKAELVAEKDTYELTPAASGKEFADKLRAAEKQGQMPAAPPKVKLTLRLTNTGDAPVTIQVGGDGSRVDLSLQGPGAVSISPPLAMTMEFRMGRPVKTEPGKSYDIPITSLASGMRSIGKFSYWTEPGDYTLKATYHCPVGEAQVSVSSEPVKLKVVEAKTP
jgi:hypothetical protein